jgi:hypothetical protein
MGGRIVLYYLVQLSYTAESWKQQIGKPLDIERRLKVLDTMLAELNAKVVDFVGDGPSQVIRGKFAGNGGDDLIAVLRFPDEKAALAFYMAVRVEPGVRDMRMTLMTPLEEALQVMQKAAKVRTAANYSAPGGTSDSWANPKPPPKRKK